MDIRPCPRCRKHVSSQASFCRRCGAAVGATAPRAVRRVSLPVQQTPSGRCGSVAAAVATAVVGGLLAMLAVSNVVVPVRLAESRWTTFDEAGARPSQSADVASGEARAADRGSPSLAPPRQRSIPSFRQAPRAPDAGDIVARNAPRSLGPRILEVVGGRAGAGHKVTIRGAHLGDAIRVMFIGADRGRADARFERWDDDRLLAAVPDLGSRAQDVAIAVVTPDGVAVSVPRDALLGQAGPGSRTTTSGIPPLRVVAAGEQFRGSGAPIVFVEPGAAARATAGATLFVRRGGSVFGRSGADCLLFCEPGVLDRPDTPAVDCFEVEAVNPCLVDSLFHYTGR
jgi:hypothetical protein